MLAARILPLLIAVLAGVGLVMPTTAAHAHAGTVVAVATAADDIQHAGSVDATAEVVAERADRSRRATRVTSPANPLVRAVRRLSTTSWSMPARVVGGVPPGRAPPAPGARTARVLPTLA